MSTRPRIALAAVAMMLGAAGCRDSSAPAGGVVAISARPYGLAVAGERAFVTQLDAASVMRASVADAPSLEGSFAAGFIPTGVAVTPDGGLALVASQDGRVTLHSGSGELLKTFTMRGSGFRAVISRDGSRGYALSSVGDVLVVDLAARAAVATVVTDLGAANGLALNRAGTVAYVTSMAGGIVAVDLGTRTVSRRYDVTGLLQDATVSPNGLELLVADETGSVVALTLATGATQRVPVSGAFGLALTPDDAQLWVTAPGTGQIAVLDATTRAPIRTVLLHGGNSTPRRIAFDASGAAVVTDESGFLHVIR